MKRIHGYARLYITQGGKGSNHKKKDVRKVDTGLNVQQGNLGDVFSSLGGLTIEKVYVSRNKDTHEENVGQCLTSTSANVAPNEVSQKPVTGSARSDATRLSHPSQYYDVTWTLDYTVTSFKLARWKVRISGLRCKPLKGTMTGLDINTLTMEQYLASSRENQAPGAVKPEIRGNINFEIKSQFM
nr:hypothetical protein [Tanacetum cinerariifolium]